MTELMPRSRFGAVLRLLLLIGNLRTPFSYSRMQRSKRIGDPHCRSLKVHIWILIPVWMMRIG